MKKERTIAKVAYIAVVGFLVFDVIEDFELHQKLSHILFEIALIFSVSTISLIFILKLISSQKALRIDLDQTRTDLKNWKHRSSVFIKGLSDEIEKQFNLWSLTNSEKEVALYIIKGLSVKEISQYRSTAEKTVRAQLSSIYKKSGVHTRSELSAFFLEDLLVVPAK